MAEVSLSPSSRAADRLTAVIEAIRAAVRRLPVIARRDQRIEKLSRRVAGLQKASNRLYENPSFYVRLGEEQRLRELELELGAPSRSVIAGGKFHVYDIVQSHGIAVPEQFGRWDDPSDIAWDDLPDTVVVKSAFGAGSRGVLLLRRAADGWEDITSNTVCTSEELTADLVVRAENETARPPFVAEEFLDDGSGGPPIDVKVFAFYGEVPLAMLRRVHGEGAGVPGRSPIRFVDVHGTDMPFAPATAPMDTTIPVPDAMDELFDTAARISTIIRAPFSRIDLYRVKNRVVFGEVTPRPGMKGRFAPELDARLGDAWERAQVRLWRDLADGVSSEPLWGPLGDQRGRSS
jgi:hypothetical protein